MGKRGGGKLLTGKVAEQVKKDLEPFIEPNNQFQWTILDGKKYCTQSELASMLGVKQENLKRHLSQRQINPINLMKMPGTKKVLYPYEFVCIALFMLEVKSDQGKLLKEQLVKMAVSKIESPKLLLPAPPKATRDELREEVAKIATHNDIPYSEIWHRLWNELYYRPPKVNIKLRAKNADKKPLDIIDELGLCGISISILKEVYA